MFRFSRFLIFFVLFQICVTSSNSQRLPEGKYHAIRERTYDIIHYKLEASFDFAKKRIIGTSTITLRPLNKLNSFSLDAIQIDVRKVSDVQSNKALEFESSNQSLEIQLPNEKDSQDTIIVKIQYQANPKGGMYFHKDRQNPDLYFMTTYGEDGLHANWLPIYNDVNDKFSSEMVISVPEPYVVVSNGVLVEESKTGNQRKFHWLQKLPHPNYLIALYVGEFEKGELPPAFGKIPMNFWVPRGRMAEGTYTFRNTTRMVEHFSKRFNYDYPWDKYDQIAFPDYAIGAMEHTGITGHRDNVLRDKNAPLEFEPTFTEYFGDWSSESIISHELAHHWFGNLLTCRNLSYLWLNESFASYLMMLWDEESLGKDQLLFDVYLAKKHYFDFVRNQHMIRPLEYHNFDDANTIYNTEHTYLKGAVILHMLRFVLGDEAYFNALSYYLHKHEYSNVVSNDLQIAIQEATGQNLKWFFDDWVTGGGHPVFEVSYRYLPSKKLVDLSVSQIQPIIKGQGLFTLPVNVTIVTDSKSWTKKLWLKNANHKFLLNSESKPLMVSFDGEGALVAEINFNKSEEELGYQAMNDAVPGRIRAIKQLSSNYPNSDKTAEIFERILKGKNFWAIKAETAQNSGRLHSTSAQKLIELALKQKDYRIRKAAILALTSSRKAPASEKLQQIIKNEIHSDVVAAAIVALAKVDPGINPDLIKKQLNRTSWYDEIKQASLIALGQLADKKNIPVLKKYSSENYSGNVRIAALNAWESCDAEDKDLHRLLIKLTDSPDYTIQQTAIAALGRLHVEESIPKLEAIVLQNADANLVTGAKNALVEIKRIVNSK